VLNGCFPGDDPKGTPREGGSIIVGASAAPSSLDPALATDKRALQTLWLVYTPLLSLRHAEGQQGTEPIPGVARALPEVSDDGLTYTLRLRSGLRYSNGALVRAGDFERTIDRVRALHSPLARLYDGIESIEADADSGTIRMTLTRRAPTFEHVLALPSSAPLPRGTPIKNLSGRPPAGIGAYRINQVDLGRRVVLTRVRDFRLPGVPPGYVDRIVLRRGGSRASEARAAIASFVDVMQETAATDLLPELRSKYRDRYREDPTSSTVALIPSTETPPLDDPVVRRAIGQSLDGQKLVRLYEGLLESSCNFLPETVPGYRRLDPCPYGDRDEPPDLVDAKDRIQEAVAPGTPVSIQSGPGVPRRVAQYVVRTLRKIGLDARRRGGAAARLRIARFAPLVVHAAAFLEPFAHRSLDPQLNEAVADGVAEPSEGEEADDAWASADERVVGEAYAIPLGSQRRPTLFSERIDLDDCTRVHPVFGLDLSSLCLK
jgi:peptide/nickel transport system substrate-binding protein